MAGVSSPPKVATFGFDPFDDFIARLAKSSALREFRRIEIRPDLSKYTRVRRLRADRIRSKGACRPTVRAREAAPHGYARVSPASLMCSIMARSVGVPSNVTRMVLYMRQFIYDLRFAIYDFFAALAIVNDQR